MDYLLFGSGLYMVLMAFLWLVQPARGLIGNYFAAMYSSTGFIVLYAWAERTGLVYQVFLLYNLQIPLCFVFAPLLYYGFSQIIDLHGKPAAFFWPHFLPALVSLPLVVANNVLNASAFAGLPADPAPGDLQGQPAFFVLHLLGLGSNAYILYFVARILWIGVTLMRKKDLEHYKELGLLLVFVAWFALDIVLMVAGHLSHNAELVYLAKFLAASCFIFYSFYSFRYPEFTQKIIHKSKQIRYKNTQLKGMKTDELLGRLDELMTKEKLFTDIELTLTSLSSRLKVTPHQLSEVFNDRLKVNFRTYLNDLRVQEAKRRLRDHPDQSVLEVAFGSGFNSKASFNDHFVRQTGLTPTQYRKDGRP